MTGVQDQSADCIRGDRRQDRRYTLALDLRWKLVRRRKVVESGSGRTLDLSSTGVLFDAGRLLPVGLNVELSIAWPALLHDIAPMQLAISGADGGRTGVRLLQHEFRTAGSGAESPAGARPRSAILPVSSSQFKFRAVQ